MFVHKLTVAVVVTALHASAFQLAAADKSPTQSAQEEAVRRQATVMVIKETLIRAQAAQKGNDFLTAAALYEESLNLTKKIEAVGVKSEQDQALSGLTSVRMKLAETAHNRLDFAEAGKQMDLLLKYDPKSKTGAAYKKYNKEVAEAYKGRMPSKETLAMIPEVQQKKLSVATMVQDGKLLFEMRKLDEAEAKLREAVKLDPDSKAGFYYLSLIQEERHAEEARKRDYMQKQRLVEVEKSWEIPQKRELLPSPNPYIRTNSVNTSTRSRQAILSKLDKITIKELSFDGLQLVEVLNYLVEQTKPKGPDGKSIPGKPAEVNFLINSFIDDQPAVTGGAAPGGLPGASGPIDPLGNPLPAAPAAAPQQPVDLANAIVRITPAISDLRLIDALDAICKSVDPQSIGGRGLKYVVEDYAVVFTRKTIEPVQMYSRIFKVNPNTFVQGLQGVSGIDLLGTIGSGLGSGGGGGQGGGGGGGGGGRSGGGGGQGGGQGGSSSDSALTIPRVSTAGGSTSGGGQGGGGGGGGGGQGGGGGGQSGSGISFVTYTNNLASVNALVRDFFVAAGVNLASNATGAASTQVFFNDRTGVLMVRASMQDLEIIQAAIEVLNIAPPQVSIEAKFAEVTQQDQKGLGFDWILGQYQLGGGTVAQPGTTPSLFDGQTATSVFPGNINFPNTVSAPSATDGFLTGSLRHQIGIGSQQSTLPTLGTITGILTDPQFRVIIRALEQRDGVDVLSAPRVTTLSGRQAQVQVVDLVTIVSGVNVNQTTATSGSSLAGGASTGAVGSTASYTTTPLPFGPVLDVMPSVSADGFSIEMTLIPTFTEFIGYDNPGAFVPQAQSVGGATVGVPLTAVLPLPRLRTRQVVTSCIVWDAQTVMLGGLISEDVRNVRDKVPVLGDVPLIGRLFRSESKSTSKKNLIIFVTPTIVDPAGNRVHADDELPFAKSAIPPQVPFSSRDRNYNPQ